MAKSKISVGEDDDLAFLTSEERDLFKVTSLGSEAVDFLATTLGMHVRAYAVQEIYQAQNEFCNVDPADTEAVRKLQFRASVPAMFLAFLNEAIVNGEQAHNALIQREQENTNA